MRKKLPLFLFMAFCCAAAYSQQVPCLSCFAGRDTLYNNNPNNHFAKVAAHHPMPANGNGTLGQSYINQNVCGLNYTQVSQLTETRTQIYNFNPGGKGFPAALQVAPIPCGGLNAAGVIKAFAYWNAEYTEGSPPAATITITNPLNAVSTYTSTIIGTGAATCWGATGTADYRADVTAAIAGSGGYNMSLTGFQNVGWEVNGITVIIIYKDPSAAYTGSISLWDGAVILIGGSTNYTATSFTTCAAAPNAAAFQIASDMQSNVNANINDEDFNGSSAAFANNFWNYNEINTSLTNAQSSCVYNCYTNNGGDCWAQVALGLYWQNTGCVACHPPAGMNVVLAAINPTCGNNNGQIIVHVSGGVKPYTYKWSPNGGTDSIANNLSRGVYTIEVMSPCDTVTDTVTLQGNTLAFINDIGEVKCFNGSSGYAAVHVNGGVAPYTYSWSPVAGNTDSVSKLSAGTYICYVEDVNGCHIADTCKVLQPPVLTVSTGIIGVSCYGQSNGKAYANGVGGTPPYTYQWAKGPSGDTFDNLVAGIYTVLVNDANGCSANGTAIVTQPASLSVTATGPKSFCLNQTAVLTAFPVGGTKPYTYAWSSPPGGTNNTISVSPVVTTTYSIVITDANGCTATSSVTVDLGPPVGVTLTGAHAICQGESITLCAVPNGGSGGNSFLWQPGGQVSPCITVSPASTTLYSVTVSDNCGGRAGDSAMVTVSPTPIINFSAGVTEGCSPLCVQFRDASQVSQGQLVEWTWTFGRRDTVNGRSPIHCFVDTGHYTVQLTAVSDAGCSSTLSRSNVISVYSNPVPQFSASPQPAEVLNADIQFTDRSTDQYGLIAWSWKYGDGADSGSNLENPSHTYQDTGTYCPQLIVTNIHGCVDSIISCVVVEPMFALYIPDAFSPNGFGKNQVFMAKGDFIKDFEMYIFDRWGNELFHSTNINDGWDGTSKGTMSPEGTYVYKINVTDTKRKQHTYVGSVYLIK